jgi:uridine kinase
VARRIVISAQRRLVLDRVVDHLLAAHPGDRPLRVAVDGITAAGKTTWAGELAAAVEVGGRPAVPLSLDGFHHPRARRYRQGRTSPAGYYADAYDVAALRRFVLEPLGPGGSRQIRTRVHDLASDAPVDDESTTVPPDAVILVDGTFLQRPELDGGWDQAVYVDTDPAVARARARQRDAALFGSPEAVEEMYLTRYHPACALYIAERDPVRRATVVIGNDDVAGPVLRRTGPVRT